MAPIARRKRMKHHFNAIRAQMEFYFGDANLSKDRFLTQLIEKDPYVPLEVFLTFNKLKLLTTTADEIVKALSNSELLEFDEAKLKVRRRTALPAERYVDEKTLYVEALPPTADHDWVRKIFERFGVVTYVSLPKYAKSRKIKEFAFVEFEQEGSVENAVRAFKEFNGVLNMQEADPAELKSVTSFVNEQIKQHEKPLKEDKTTKKRNLDEAETEETTQDEPKTKKIKTESVIEEKSHRESIKELEQPKKDEDVSSSSSSSESGEESNKDEDKQNEDCKVGAGNEGDQVKRRKRKKKSKTAKKRLEASATDATYYELKILPKRDWKRLRNKYLNLQREKIAELKRKAWQEQKQAQRHPKETAEQLKDDSTGVNTSAKQSKPNERKFHKMNMNFYGAGDDEQQTKRKQNLALDRTPLFAYEPGLIVEVNFMEACVNVKEFKADMRQYATVKYVDVKEGCIYAHLRLESATAADEFIKQMNCAEYKCKVLCGEAESEYWKKIERDREMKLNKQVKVPQKRGREKIKKLVTKHIRFGDDE